METALIVWCAFNTLGLVVFWLRYVDLINENNSILIDKMWKGFQTSMDYVDTRVEMLREQLERDTARWQ